MRMFSSINSQARDLQGGPEAFTDSQNGWGWYDLCAHMLQPLLKQEECPSRIPSSTMSRNLLKMSEEETTQPLWATSGNAPSLRQHRNEIY